MTPEILKSLLSDLRLPAAARELESVLSSQKKAVTLGWVTDLLEREIDARRETSLKNRIKSARFPEITTLEGFDFGFNPDIDEEKIRELATLKFMDQNQIALFLGAPGVGKTHLALAIGVLAVRDGRRVFCTSAKRLSQEIMLGRMRGNLDQLFKRLLSAQLWIIDDWGVVSMNREVAEEIFDLMDRRKHSSAMILTSNRDVSEWAEVFPDPVIANATVDRIFDRAKTVLFKGQSYRLKGRIETREIKEVDDTGIKH
ncbi:MAG: IS21-like element helper ATPase IstB [Nitrospiraceae bacterium]|jgi:DNA replication protein DnaC|nr:IS21-like element helper ATPase IstB [Nitrospiraceae bacterium]